MQVANFNRSKGFNLIELMIVVSLIAILSAIAIPQYSQYVVRGNRSAAQAYMMDIASREKQYLLDARSYTDTIATLQMGTMPKEVASNYTLSITTTDVPPSFTITATPIAGSKQALANDGELSLTDAGVKLPADKW